MPIHLLRAPGIEVDVQTFGARIAAIRVPDRDGWLADVTLGCGSEEQWRADTSYLGATAGRYANRIAGGRITLDGQPITLSTNDIGNHLHGGEVGFDRRDWTVVDAGEQSITLEYVSPDGEMGYPGTLTATLTFSVQSDPAVLVIDYSATTDAPTLCNLTNHSYLNLTGKPGGIDGHVISIVAERYLPVGTDGLPNGEPRPVDGTPFDLRTPTPIGRSLRLADPAIMATRGFDHSWLTDAHLASTPPVVATVTEPTSGRTLTVRSDQPALHFYSGNFLDGTTPIRDSLVLRQGDAFCLEPGLPPDTPNHPEFGSAILRPGDTYRQRHELEFGTDA